MLNLGTKSTWCSVLRNCAATALGDCGEIILGSTRRRPRRVVVGADGHVLRCSETEGERTWMRGKRKRLD